MFYLKNNSVNILFIHIPKTEGSHVKEYLQKKFNTNLLCEHNFLKKSAEAYDEHTFYQHILYNNTMEHKNMYIVTVVKNPYSRIIKYLLQSHKIDNVSKNNIYNLIKNIIDTGEIQPQYKFIANKNEEVHKEIHILHSELLEYEMYLMGHHDFYLNENMNDHINYFDYIDSDTVQLINKYFSKDFDLLGYPKHSVK